MLSRSRGVRAVVSRACSITLYSSPRSTNVVTMREPSMVSSVRPTVCSETPRSAARVAVDRARELRLALVVVGFEVEEARVLRGHSQHDLSRHCASSRSRGRPARSARACCCRAAEAAWFDVDAHARDVLRSAARRSAGDLLRAVACARPTGFSGRMTQAGVDVGAAAEAAGCARSRVARCRARPRPCDDLLDLRELAVAV